MAQLVSHNKSRTKFPNSKSNVSHGFTFLWHFAFMSLLFLQMNIYLFLFVKFVFLCVCGWHTTQLCKWAISGVSIYLSINCFIDRSMETGNRSTELLPDLVKNKIGLEYRPFGASVIKLWGFMRFLVRPTCNQILTAPRTC